MALDRRTRARDLAPMESDKTNPAATDLRADVLIVGGGLTGLTLACALAGAGAAVAVVDREAPAVQTETAYDGRASAIAFASARVLRGIGIWPALESAAEPILDIRVADGHPARGVSHLFLHYDHRDVGDEPFGYIVENRATPQLAVAADGRNSRIRSEAGIGAASVSYGQTAIVCTVAAARSHAGVAVELFLPGGPFAMLPMTDSRCNIVWSERADLAADYLELDDDAFLDELGRRFGDWPGPIELTGPRFAYPLGLLHADRYTEQRLALVGDAAHGIHPIAGQGLNLGLRDVAALAELVIDARRLGLDLAGPAVLDRYARWRRFDNVLLAAVTDGLNRLFSNDIPPLRLARDLGLAAVDRLPPAKRFLMRHAMGIVGDLPRLVRGEAL
jgi:2-octaprenyl-6-methoxyphenol hydroxylase